MGEVLRGLLTGSTLFRARRQLKPSNPKSELSVLCVASFLLDHGGRMAVGMSRRCDTDPFLGLCHDGPARRHRQGPTSRVVTGLVAHHGETEPVGSSPYGDSGD